MLSCRPGGKSVSLDAECGDGALLLRLHCHAGFKKLFMHSRYTVRHHNLAMPALTCHDLHSDLHFAHSLACTTEQTC